MASQDARLSKFEANFKQQQSEMTTKIDTVLKVITDRMAGGLPSDTIKNPKLNVNSTSPVSSAQSQAGKPQEEEEKDEKDNSENINTNPSSPHDPSASFITEKDDDDMMFIEIINKNDDSYKEEPEVGENAGVGELEVEYFNKDVRQTLKYHATLDMCILRKPT
ncbi:hypothetical protein Tco_1178023 [Tanacetum coccineum]